MATQKTRRFGNFYKKFGEKCRRLRRQRGMTQEGMMQFGFDRRHYQSLEAGKAFHMDTAIRLSKAFKISLSELFDGLR